MSISPYYYQTPATLKREEFEAIRWYMLNKDTDIPLYLNLGHFITRYAHVEAAITSFLYWAICNHPAKAKLDPRMFEQLVWGMDAKTKATRLKAALKIRDVVIPKHFLIRLNHYSHTIADLRNSIVHGNPVWLPDEDALGIFRASDFMPWGTHQPERGALGDPEIPQPSSKISGTNLFEASFWLTLFCLDLFEILEGLIQKPRIRIKKYRSREPREHRQPLLKTTPLAKPRKPSQKQAAKRATALAKKKPVSSRAPKQSAKQRRVEATSRAKKAPQE